VGQPARTLLVLILLVRLEAPAHSQGRTDVVTLRNGDRITGEVVRFERGRLEFKTDDAGTLYLEWDNLASVVTTRLVEVTTTDGRRFLGSLTHAADRSIAVLTPGGTVLLTTAEVTSITPIGRNFWKRLDGSFDAGFSYTRSSGVAQLNVDSDTIYRRPAFQGRLKASVTQTKKEDEPDIDGRASVEASYLRYPWRRWVVLATSRFERNESLGLALRSQIGAAAGPRLVNTNRAQVAAGAGIVVNDERGIDVEPVRNLEALLVFVASYYTYDRPKTNLDLNLQYYPGLSNAGRHRVQLDAGVKRELWKDFFVGLSSYSSYDSRPPNPAADTSDVGVVMSIGWSY
jgi:hypothetical protein